MAVGEGDIETLFVYFSVIIKLISTQLAVLNNHNLFMKLLSPVGCCVAGTKNEATLTLTEDNWLICRLKFHFHKLLI